ncbi:hypothetical protein STAFG_3094 [Streptomyces afghaniensis 772]|uniref:HTH hxlR-type domain-containing protein n=1 Tax=Streptomyces afghaniensis 772 TaxID=1283301 RepID=S4MK19_9ACTN|nr:winged helix-turn-helix transcriptional regulator [Streptomyces afghaniensis]EPJ39878.1 hypothetical protein STAFG_3094 [Streptomyces afghaniensis 772]
MDLLGDWWTPLVLREAFYGIRRFDAFQVSPGIARNTLTDRLRRLVDMATVTAAARAGARYFDSTGEGPFARRVLLELDSVAAARGATLVPAFGYDYVPGNLAGALALEQAGERACHVEIGYFITRSGRGSELQYRSTLRDSWDLTTGGTRQTLVAAAAEDGFAYRTPRPGASSRLVDERAAERVLTFRSAGVRRPAMTVPDTEHLGLPEVFPQLESVEVGMGWLGRWTRPVQIAAMLQAPLLRSAKVRAALTRWSGRLRGAHREPDTDGRFPGDRGRPRRPRSSPGHDGPHRT